MSTCFFIGHRDAPDSILPSLSAAIETRIVEDGVDQFVVGKDTLLICFKDGTEITQTI